MIETKELISVIIPVYNAEKTIERTVQSVIDQKRKQFDIEVLLVDDGSRDNSGKICDNLSKENNCVVVIKKENGGVSSARNVGLEHVHGKYILFVDSDDLLLESALQDMYENMKKTSADLVWMGFDILRGSKRSGGFCLDRNATVEAAELREMLGRLEVKCTTFVGAPWGKLFRRDLIESYDIRFPQNTCYGEDFCFCADYFRKCKNISFIAKAGYLYNMREESLATYFEPDSIEMYTFLHHKKVEFYKSLPDTIRYINTMYVEKMIACFEYILNCREIQKSKLKYMRRVVMADEFQDVLRQGDYDMVSPYVRLMVKLSVMKKVYIIYGIARTKNFIVKRSK